MKIPFHRTDSDAYRKSDLSRFLLLGIVQLLVMILFTLMAGPSGWCTLEQEGIKQEGVWKDYRKPFEEDILVSQVATIRVSLPKRFFKAERVTLSVTTDATPHSQPRVSIGTWERDLGAFLTPAEYFTTLALTETINLEIPIRHFQKGENEIKFYSLTDRPEDQYIVTKLEFRPFREEARAIPRREAPEKVRIGILTSLSGGSIRMDKGNYVGLLTDEIRKKPNRDVIPLKEAIHYRDLNIDTALLLRQRYQIDMLVGIANTWQHGEGFRGITKLIDISAQRLIELDPVDIGAGYAEFRPGWEKKLVSEQIGPIEKMIAEISRAKIAAKKPEEGLEVAAPAPIELRKVRIGVITELQKNLEREYFKHLTAVLEKREDSELLLLVGQVTYDAPHPEAIEGLKRKHQIDMIIYVGTKAYSTGELYWTGLVDTSKQKFVEVPKVYVKQENRYRWEKMLVERQIKPIENMIHEISREKTPTAL